MVTITLGSFVVQDPSWGGPGVVPVPRGPAVRVNAAGQDRILERDPAERDAVSVLSMRLLGLVEITQTKTSQRSS